MITIELSPEEAEELIYALALRATQLGGKNPSRRKEVEELSDKIEAVAIAAGEFDPPVFRGAHYRDPMISVSVRFHTR